MPDHDDDDALLAALVGAYSAGYFPMADPEDGTLGWYSPEERAVIPLEPGGLHVARSMARRIRSGRFVVTSDAAFERVTRACAEPRPGRMDTWIDERILHAYGVLHRAGCAHSVEAWVEAEGSSALPASEPAGSGTRRESRRELVGGVYGVSIGGVFFAESMFSRPERGGTDASKVCLAYLVAHLRERGFAVLDVQIINPHTRRLGAVEVPRAEFLRRLGRAVRMKTRWEPFAPDPLGGVAQV